MYWLTTAKQENDRRCTYSEIDILLYSHKTRDFRLVGLDSWAKQQVKTANNLNINWSIIKYLCLTIEYKLSLIHFDD